MKKISFPVSYRKWRFAVPGFFAIVFGFGVWSFSASQESGNSSITPQQRTIDTQPVRGEFQPLRLKRYGFVFKCTECHQTFRSPVERRVLVAEHTDLKLDHGRNDYCFNCHHLTNRGAYSAHDGSEISSDEPTELCAKCHGLVYRDWEIGAHGRVAGYWDRTKGQADRLFCIQCHDPHAPKFPKIAPMSGPESTSGLPHKGER